MRQRSIFLALIIAGCGSSIRATGDADEGDGPSDPGIEVYVDVPSDPSIEPVADVVPEPVTDTGPDTTPSGGLTGDACVEDHECTGVPGEERFCMDYIDLGGGYGVSFPGGYCSAYCSSTTECGVGADCIDFSYLGLCFKRCTSDGDCRVGDGYVCYPIPYVTTEPYCVPYM